MKKIKYQTEKSYFWDCPECETCNEPDEDPGQKEKLICEGCGAEFKNDGEDAE